MKDDELGVKERDMRSRGGVLVKAAGPLVWHSEKHTLSLAHPKSGKGKVVYSDQDEKDNCGYIALHTMEAEYITVSGGVQLGRQCGPAAPCASLGARGKPCAGSEASTSSPADGAAAQSHGAVCGVCDP